jgi:para-nitrobenzyl esterase
MVAMSVAALDGCAGSDNPRESTASADQAESFVSAKPDDPSLVRVTTGLVRGRVKPGYRQFLGIPYAAAPTDELRWRPPQPPASWRGVRDASVPKAVCPQFVYTAPGVGRVGGDEDCLVLNVTVPDRPSKKNLPVMVWIHGGGYTSGSGVEQDPVSLVQKAGVIVVTINYRLGALGFLAHPALTAESRDNSGNFGLLDQQAALAWVKSNIGQFGGDPSNVTLFGVSAGGNSVWAHILSPKSAGLFRRAVSISGLWSTSWNWMGYDEPAQPFRLADAEANGMRYAQALGCNGSDRSVATCLRNTTLADLGEMSGSDMGPVNYLWGPTTGGGVLPRPLKEAVAAGAFNRVPIISGSTHDEAMPSVMMPFWLYMNNPLTTEVYAQTLAMRFGDDASSVQGQYPADAYSAAIYAYAAVDTDVQNACYTRTINRLAAAHTKVYAYEFNDPNAPSSNWNLVFGGALPYPPLAYHASDVQYIFPSLNNTEGFADEQIQLSDRMIEYYASFAQSGSPRGVTPWRTYDPALDVVQSLTPAAITATPSFATEHKCEFWEKLRGI